MRLRILSIAAAVAFAVSGPAQVVTATKWVSHGKGKELLRKINGRWWTRDNREVYPPSRTGVFWEVDSNPGVVDFYHHEPFDLEKAELLHLFMTQAQVEPLLGHPNRIFRMGPAGGMWYYYSANGTKVQVRFMDGVVGEAEYDPLQGKSYSVASIERELAGRSIYKLMAERAGKRSEEEQARRVAEMRSRLPLRSGSFRTGPSMTVVNVPAASEPAPKPERRVIAAEALAGIKIGMSRADVLAALNEPSSRFSMTGGDGVRESFRYHLADGRSVEIRLVDAKVVEIP